MSYILDALKKADAQRARGAVPGISTPAAGPQAGAPQRGRSRYVMALVVVNLVVLAGLAWWLKGPSSVPVVAAAPGAVSPAWSAAASVNGATTAPASAPRVIERSGAAGTVPPAAVQARPAAPSASAPAVAPATPQAASATPAAVASTAQPAAPVAATSSGARPPPRLYALAELPDDVRRELPTLAINGAMHSENRADRLLMVSGRLLREGDEVAPGVVIEEIQARAAVLGYRGYRYRVVW